MPLSAPAFRQYFSNENSPYIQFEKCDKRTDNSTLDNKSRKCNASASLVRINGHDKFETGRENGCIKSKTKKGGKNRYQALIRHSLFSAIATSLAISAVCFISAFKRDKACVIPGRAWPGVSVFFLSPAL